MVLLSISFVSCVAVDSLEEGNVDDLYAVMSVSFIPAIVDPERDSFPTISIDEYGRKLFVYVGSQGGIGPLWIWAFVCQDSDDTYSYFYEDICCQPISRACYFDLKNKKKDVTQYLPELLERNDWGKPLDKSKCSKVCHNRYMKGYRNSLKLFGFDDVGESYDSETRRYTNVVGICGDEEDYQLWLYVESDRYDYYALKAYIIKDCEITAQADISIDDLFNEIHRFKQENVFGKSKTYYSYG